MLKRLRIKFVVINMTIVTLMLCVIFSMSYHFTRQGLESSSLDMMRTVATAPFCLGAPVGPEGAQARLPYFTVHLGSGGEVVTVEGYYDAAGGGDALRRLVDDALSGPSPTGVLEAYDLRYLRLATPGHDCIVFADTTSEQATLRGMARSSMMIGAAAFAVFLAVSIFLSRWAVKPVERAWRQQRQFVADASHELKTPLAVITANAELLQEPEYTAAEKERFSAGILAMTQQMRRLVEQLLSLARIDDGQQAEPCGLLDLSGLVGEALLPFEPMFFEKGLTLESCVRPGIYTVGCGGQLRQVLQILLDNAAKYADAPGEVLVTLERHGRGRCLLTVANTGTPIPAEALPHLFERFYRADPARSRDGSFGLGLSIAQTIVARHRGRIRAESGGGWNRFLVELPAKGRRQHGGAPCADAAAGNAAQRGS